MDDPDAHNKLLRGGCLCRWVRVGVCRCSLCGVWYVLRMCVPVRWSHLVVSNVKFTDLVRALADIYSVALTKGRFSPQDDSDNL